MMLTENLGCLSLLFVSAKFDGIIVIHSYLIKFKCLFSSCSGRELDLLTKQSNWKSGKKGGSKLCDYCCRPIVKGLFGVSQVKIIESIIQFF